MAKSTNKITTIFKKIALKKFWFEYLILACVISAFLLFVFHLKLGKKKEHIFVEGKIVFQDISNPVPSSLVSGLEKGARDLSGRAEVVDFHFFYQENKEWFLEENYISGRVLVRIQAENRGNSYFYNDQELFVGNNYFLDLEENRKLELLITSVGKDAPKDAYHEKTVVLKIYNKRFELIDDIVPGLKLRTTSGLEYAEIVDVQREHSPTTTVNNQGSIFLRQDPLNYDVTLRVKTLVKEENGRVVGFDDHTIALGTRFFFNNPWLQRIDAYVVEIE